MIRLEMKNCNINTEAVKISALSPGETDKYKYLTCKEILHPDQSTVIEQVKFTYSSLGKASEKQTKKIEDQAKKQVQVLKVLRPVEHEQKLKSIEGIFPKHLESV